MSTNSIFLTPGERIQYARKQKNMTQEELGKRIGISRSFVNHLETDRKKPSLETLIKLAKALNVGVDYLADDNAKIVLDKLQQQENPRSEKRSEYDAIIDKAIAEDITPNELAAFIEMISRYKDRVQNR